MKLLTPSDPPPHTTLNQKQNDKIIVICDHASKLIPKKLKNLGLTQEILNQHIGWDIGAAKIAQGLSEILNATAILSAYSRLVIDVNRQPDSKDSIPMVSHDIPIPGNQNLGIEEKRLRIKEIFKPYHHKISQELKAAIKNQTYPILFSIHTFTPTINGKSRPWDAGILWNRDQRIAISLIKHLKLNPSRLTIGNNQPYSGKHYAYSLDLHAGLVGLPNCAIEIRQDLVQSKENIERWVSTIAEALLPILKDPKTNQIKF